MEAQKRGREKVRSNKFKHTQGFDGEKYSPELIRKYENPEYAKAAEQYEKEARRKRKKGTEPPSEGRRHKVKKKYRLNKGKMLRNFLIVLLLLAIAGTVVFFQLTDDFDHIDTKNADFAIDDQVADDLSGYRNIAILGVDARADEGYDGSRTDAIIIMSIKKSNGDIRLISVMRDSYLRMQHSDGSRILDKITHAHHWAGGVNTCAALNESLDLNIDEFVIFNWTAVADAVDCLGGVEIKVRSRELNDLNKWGYETAANVGRTYHRIKNAGTQTLDGVQATTYCRIRKTSGGDAGRSQRYKKVVAAVMKKALTHPWKLDELSKTVFPNVRTNMSQFGMLAATVRAPGYELMKSINWPKDYYEGALSDGIDYIVPTTLISNVERLHRIAFGQNNYTASEPCRQVSQDIINDTGIQ